MLTVAGSDHSCKVDVVVVTRQLKQQVELRCVSRVVISSCILQEGTSDREREEKVRFDLNRVVSCGCQATRLSASKSVEERSPLFAEWWASKKCLVRKITE